MARRRSPRTSWRGR